MKAHVDDPWAARFPPARFELRGTRHADEPEIVISDIFKTCTYCGSIEFSTLLEALKTPGTEYSGCDWKYGWPHKFYVDIPCEPYEDVLTTKWNPDGTVEREMTTRSTRHHKFYSTHLFDCAKEELAAWNEIAFPKLGIKVLVKENGELGFQAPCAGYQAHGIVGEAKR